MLRFSFYGAKHVQLHRRKFLDRLKIEAKLQQRLGKVCHFFVIVIMYLTSLGIYDPLVGISDVHDNLRVMYNMNEKTMKSIQSPDQVMSYVQSFIEITYEMASALVDANTLDTIDLLRCFDKDTMDVCRAKYWETPIRRQNSPNFFNVSRLLENNANDSASIEGLMPGNPIMMDSTRDFPYAQVVPLAPIVWQIRAPRVPCEGFGSVYNKDILGAGECAPEEAEGGCDPNRLTTIKALLPNEQKTRKVYITYDSKAFFCVDRRKQETTFCDKSWHPRATYSDMKNGSCTQSTNLAGNEVFWKFISDVRYLQAPILGDVYFNRHEPCKECKGWQLPNCTDPLEVGATHPMWGQFDSHKKCSARAKWIEEYLGAERRINTFLTAETSQLTVASVVMTPSMAGLLDIATLVRVVFDISQTGNCNAAYHLSSTADTDEAAWISCCAITMLLTGLFAIRTLRDWKHGEHNKEGNESRSLYIFDLICCAAIFIHLIWNMVLDFSPPHILPELKTAFKRNEPRGYFDCISHILDYNQAMYALKRVGFFVVLVVFGRLVHLLSVHPRLNLIVAVTERAASDLFHFLVQYVFFLSVLSFLGHWMFGPDRPAQYGTFVASAYTLTRFFIGDFTNSDKPPGEFYFIFILFYATVAFIMMVSFLLAIVVDAYTLAVKDIQDDDSEMDIASDLWDTFKTVYYIIVRKWPGAAGVVKYLNDTITKGVDIDDMPAVTAEELYNNFSLWDSERMFSSVEEAERYIRSFAFKLWVSNAWYLPEERGELLFQKGRYYGDNDNDPLGIDGRLQKPETDGAAVEQGSRDAQVMELELTVAEQRLEIDRLRLEMARTAASLAGVGSELVIKKMEL